MLLDLVNAEGPTVDLTDEQAWAADLINSTVCIVRRRHAPGDTLVANVLDELERSLLEIVHGPSKAIPAELTSAHAYVDAAALLFKVRILADELHEREVAPGTRENHMSRENTMSPNKTISGAKKTPVIGIALVGLLSVAGQAVAGQPPAPPRPAPAPRVAPVPRPVPAPQAPLAPLPPAPPVAPWSTEPFNRDFHFDFNRDFDFDFNFNPDGFNLNLDLDAIRESAREAAESAREAFASAMPFRNFAFDFSAQVPPPPPPPPAGPFGRGARGTQPGQIEAHTDVLYRQAQLAIDQGRFERAIEQLDRLVNMTGNPRIDAALYWKSYTLNKQGQRAEALSTLADLQKRFADSRWLKDAKALEVEVRQASGPGGVAGDTE